MFPEFFDQILKYSFKLLTYTIYTDNLFKIYLIIKWYEEYYVVW